MSIASKTLSIPALVTRAAVGSVNAEKRTADLIFTTGAKVLRRDWEIGPFLEELSLDPKHVRMDRLNNGAPFLADHNGSSVAGVIGVVESARISGGKGLATVRFAAAGISPEADRVFDLVRDRVVQNVSVGYRVHQLEKVEGGDGAIPTYRAIDWEPHEVSAVAIGADDGAGFRGATAHTNPCLFTTRSTLESDAMKTTDAEIAVKNERERVSAIRSAVKAGNLGDEIVTRMIDDGTTADAARAFVLENMVAREVPIDGHSGIGRGEDESEKFARGAIAWLGEKSGTGVFERAARAGVKGFESVSTGGDRFRGMRLLEVAAACLEHRGVRTRGLTSTRIAELALSQRSGGGYATPSDFPILFENMLGKELMGAYATTPDTWSKFCRVENVTDFRDAGRFRAGSLASLPVVPADAEYQNAVIPDGAKITIQTETRGNIIAIGRQAIVNDDLGALANLAAAHGRAAKMSIEKAVYALIAENSGLGPTMSDTNPFFHSSRSNVGAAGALSVATIDADRVVMAAQLDVGGNDILDLRPAVLLVPSALGGAARVLNASAFDHDSTKLNKPNAVANLFREVVDSARLTASATRRYLFADPAIAAAFAVVFLDGVQGPTLTSQEGFRRDGIELKARIDFKACPMDPKGSVTNAGT